MAGGMMPAMIPPFGYLILRQVLQAGRVAETEFPNGTGHALVGSRLYVPAEHLTDDRVSLAKPAYLYAGNAYPLTAVSGIGRPRGAISAGG
jgi:hypothetical protein